MQQILTIGTRLAARYRVVELAGRGGMGEVYRAEDLETATDVAIKVVSRRMVADETARRRFEREALLLSDYPHESLVPVLAMHLDEDPPFIVQELLHGRDLERTLLGRAQLSEGELRQLAMTLATALCHLHEHAVTHRDIKPGNIFVEDTGRFRLMDLGLADLSGLTSLTATNFIVGTPLYLPPEVVRGGEATEASDIYQVGLILYEAYCGEPYHVLTEESLRHFGRDGHVLETNALPQDGPRWLVNLISRCLQVDLAFRLPDGAALRHALDSYAAVEGEDEPSFLGSDTRFSLVGLLGKGGMGRVYLAHDQQLRRDVALKVLNEDLTNDEACRLRFEREGKTLAQLSHPNLVAIYDFETDNEKLFMVLEYLAGGDIASRIRRKWLLDWGEARKLAWELTAALVYLHDNGVIHRDIKPDNVFIDETGAFRLADFGIRALLDETRLTAVSDVVGSPRYMPPEVLRGGEYTKASDVFQLGLVLHQACTGTMIYGDGVSDNELWALLSSGSLRAGDLSADLPEDLRAIILTCCNFDVQERPRDGRALQDLLEAQLRRDRKRRPADEGRQAAESWLVARAGAIVACFLVLAALLVTMNLTQGWPSRVQPPTFADLQRDFALFPDGYYYSLPATALDEPSWQLSSAGATISGRFKEEGSSLVAAMQGLATGVRHRLDIRSQGSTIVTTSFVLPASSFSRAPVARVGPTWVELSWKLHGRCPLDVCFDGVWYHGCHDYLRVELNQARNGKPDGKHHGKLCVYRLMHDKRLLFSATVTAGFARRGKLEFPSVGAGTARIVGQPLVVDERIVVPCRFGGIAVLSSRPTSGGTTFVTDCLLPAVRVPRSQAVTLLHHQPPKGVLIGTTGQPGRLALCPVAGFGRPSSTTQLIDDMANRLVQQWPHTFFISGQARTSRAGRTLLACHLQGRAGRILEIAQLSGSEYQPTAIVPNVSALVDSLAFGEDLLVAIRQGGQLQLLLCTGDGTSKLVWQGRAVEESRRVSLTKLTADYAIYEDDGAVLCIHYDQTARATTVLPLRWQPPPRSVIGLVIPRPPDQFDILYAHPLRPGLPLPVKLSYTTVSLAEGKPVILKQGQMPGIATRPMRRLRFDNWGSLDTVGGRFTTIGEQIFLSTRHQTAAVTSSADFLTAFAYAPVLLGTTVVALLEDGGVVAVDWQ